MGISILILVILFLTWLKDGEQMHPPIKRRTVIDCTTICIFWIVFEFLDKSSDKKYINEISLVINGSLSFFALRMIQLIAQLNPTIQDLLKFIKTKITDQEEKK